MRLARRLILCTAPPAVARCHIAAVQRQLLKRVDSHQHAAGIGVHAAAAAAEALAQHVQNARLVQVGQLCEVAAGSKAGREEGELGGGARVEPGGHYWRGHACGREDCAYLTPSSSAGLAGSTS